MIPQADAMVIHCVRLFVDNFSGQEEKILENRGEKRRKRAAGVLTNGQFVIRCLG